MGILKKKKNKGGFPNPLLLKFDQMIFGMPKSFWDAKTCFRGVCYLVNLITFGGTLGPKFHFSGGIDNFFWCHNVWIPTRHLFVLTMLHRLPLGSPKNPKFPKNQIFGVSCVGSGHPRGTFFYWQQCTDYLWEALRTKNWPILQNRCIIQSFC